jgi:hypothetical protein
MKLICPDCGYEISDKLIDLSEESAFCPSCQKDFICSDWIQRSLVTPETLLDPPDGAGFDKLDGGFKVWISTRSYHWIFTLPAAIFCSCVFAFITWKVFFHSVDRWDEVGVFVLLMPFCLLAAYLWAAAALSIGGKIEVSVRGDDGNVFKGCRSIGWKRRFEWDQIKKIRIAKVYAENRRTRQKISLEGENVLSFGTGLKASRLRFMLVALRLMHQRKSG